MREREKAHNHPFYLNDAELFKKFADSYPADVVEKVVIEQQSKAMKTRAPGKYGPILFTVEHLSNYNPLTKERGKGLVPAIEVCYHFGRAMDDIADGDAKLPVGFKNYKEFVDYLKVKVEKEDHNVDKGGYVEFLLFSSIHKLANKTTPEEIRSGINRFLESMYAEYERREMALVLDRKKLDELHTLSFGTSYDIAFIATGSRNRSSDIASLMVAQGRLYALRDLDSDLSMGICNIPSEVMDKAGIGLQQLKDDPEIVGENIVLTKWVGDELREIREFYNSFNDKNLDNKAKLITRYFKWGIRWGINCVDDRINQKKH
jgi:hypothetical protein